MACFKSRPPTRQPSGTEYLNLTISLCSPRECPVDMLPRGGRRRPPLLGVGLEPLLPCGRGRGGCFELCEDEPWEGPAPLGGEQPAQLGSDLRTAAWGGAQRQAQRRSDREGQLCARIGPEQAVEQRCGSGGGGRGSHGDGAAKGSGEGWRGRGSPCERARGLLPKVLAPRWTASPRVAHGLLLLAGRGLQQRRCLSLQLLSTQLMFLLVPELGGKIVQVVLPRRPQVAAAYAVCGATAAATAPQRVGHAALDAAEEDHVGPGYVLQHHRRGSGGGLREVAGPG
mmetsp:Transcript_48386/g.121969  ORF Transcript_48386/g.121969 Transcript_48386/m.121969 type:complete len:284 (-) Transcript_48386:549-1400(-)